MVSLGAVRTDLIPCYAEGEGRWWDSRIGSDHAPSEKGGRFHLTKKSSPASPSAPPANALVADGRQNNVPSFTMPPAIEVDAKERADNCGSRQ